MNRKEFLNFFEKCPICSGKMKEVKEVLKKSAIPSTRLFKCEDCEILVGRYT